MSDELRKALERRWQPISTHPRDGNGMYAIQASNGEVRRVYANPELDCSLYTHWWRAGHPACDLAILAASSPPIGSDLDGYVLREALEYYAGTYCEGWCRDGGYFDDCGGCRARKALAAAPPVPSSAVDEGVIRDQAFEEAARIIPEAEFLGQAQIERIQAAIRALKGKGEPS